MNIDHKITDILLISANKIMKIVLFFFILTKKKFNFQKLYTFLFIYLVF